MCNGARCQPVVLQKAQGGHASGQKSRSQEPVGLGNRRLQIDRSGPFFTVFLTHNRAMGLQTLQTLQKLYSLGPSFAFDAPSATDPWAAWFA